MQTRLFLSCYCYLLLIALLPAIGMAQDTNAVVADEQAASEGEILDADIEPAQLATTPETGQISDRDSSEDHMREELGVNTYTTPSIERIFMKLQKLGPIPVGELPRRLDDDQYTNRIQLALNFGRLIAEGFLTIQTEDREEIESVGRKLVKKASALGVGDSVTAHSRQLVELGQQGDWNNLRRHLTAAQEDVEKAMLELRDEQIAHMIALGGWLRGLEIATATLRTKQTDAAYSVIEDIDLVDYFNDRLSTLHPALVRTPLIILLRAKLIEIQGILEQAEDGLYASDVEAINKAVKELNDAIQQPVDDWPEITS